MRWIAAVLASAAFVAAAVYPVVREDLPSWAMFGGRLHPALLHLPIGMLWAAAGLEALRLCRPRARLANGRHALDGACTALLALAWLATLPTIAAGVLLATEGGYDPETLQLHRWLGCGTGVATTWLLASRTPLVAAPGAGRTLGYWLLLAASMAVLTAAGHFGGVLTHGAGFLTRFDPFADSAVLDPSGPEPEPAPGADADLFVHGVQPILAAKCVECHGPDKTKSGLRLDTHAAILAGGKGGPAVVPGNPAESSLLTAVLLPEADDLHMPPADKPQLTAAEIELLGWWVERGAAARAPLADVWLSPGRRALVAATLGASALRAPVASDAMPAPQAPAQAQAQPEAQPEPDTPQDPSREDDVEAPRALGPADAARADAALAEFADHARPILAEHCFRCHGPDKQKGDVRLDALDPDMLRGYDAEGWHAALDMIQGGEMPPPDEEPMTDAERLRLTAWMRSGIGAAAEVARGEVHSVLRRLNKEQYTNTLQDLLGVPVTWGRVLPDDGKSELGFSNNGEVLQASPLHLDYYQKVAREALDQALAIGPKPEVVHYRITFGKGIGKGKVAGHTGGYQSVPLATDDFTVEILDETGAPREGRDDAEREALDNVRRRISIGLRGSSQERFRVVDEGMLLFSALPHKEVVPQAWQGPSPNLKMEMQRVFPEQGDFAFRVRASRGYLPTTLEPMVVALDEPEAFVTLATTEADAVEVQAQPDSRVLVAAKSDERKNLRMAGDALVAEDVPKAASARFRFDLPQDGIFQVDLVHPVVPLEDMPSARLTLDGRTLDLRPEPPVGDPAPTRMVTTLGAAVLRAGRHTLKVGGRFFVGFSHVVVTPLAADHPLVARLTAETEGRMAALADRVPVIRALVGTRTDDGMDYQTFGDPVEVHAPLGRAETYTIMGRLENLPIPEPETGDNEILSGFMLLGLWNDHLVKSAKETGPPLLVEAMEFQAPFLPQWPPSTHSAVFFASEQRGDETVYAREVLERFMTRAFRRPVDETEVERYLAFWRDVRPAAESFEAAVRDTLVAVLCSPNFLFLAEPADVDAGQPSSMVSEQVLATRLSYFLWNSPPDAELTDLAQRGALRGQLLDQVDRMIDDPRVWRFVRPFAREWLRLDRLESIAVNVNAYPAFTRFVKRDMAEETVRFLHHAIDNDLSVWTLIDSDFAMLNQNLAEFYGIDGVLGPDFRPVPVTPEQQRGGLLSQGAFLTGHSDGTSPHPIKRAVWISAKILGVEPSPPPPNVPDLDPETPGFEDLTLKEQLEAHRDNPSCMDCHRRLDPYGIVFEGYNAVGLLQAERKGRPVDARTVLPDGTELDGVDALKAWLASERRDAVTAALIRHLYAYALGRDLHFGDQKDLDRMLDQVKLSGYRMRSVLRSIVASPSFSLDP